MGLEIRELTMEDVPAGMRLSSAAGWNQVSADWRYFLEHPRSGGYLARRDGRVVGSVAFVRYDGLAWIAMMLVNPEHRGAGIGSQLLERALEELRGDNCVGLDATPQGEPMYRSHGLVSHYSLTRMQTTVDRERFAGLSTRARRMREGDLPAVLARDREVFGSDRGDLLTGFLRRAANCCRVVVDGGVLRGYCFGRPGRRFYQLGPLVAEDAEVAQDLVVGCCRARAGRPLLVDAPCQDEAWQRWLESVGFAGQRPFVRMLRAGHTHPGVPARQYAIAGPEFA